MYAPRGSVCARIALSGRWRAEARESRAVQHNVVVHNVREPGSRLQEPVGSRQGRGGTKHRTTCSRLCCGRMGGGMSHDKAFQTREDGHDMWTYWRRGSVVVCVPVPVMTSSPGKRWDGRTCQQGGASWAPWVVIVMAADRVSWEPKAYSPGGNARTPPAGVLEMQAWHTTDTHRHTHTYTHK